MQRFFPRILFSCILGLFLNTCLFAEPIVTPAQLPNTVQPGLIGKSLQQQTPEKPQRPLAPVTSPAAAPTSLGPQAEQIKFKLTKIVLEGNHVYSERQLSALYKDKFNTMISVGELVRIVQSITNYYRNNGYILSRAILPPQHVSGGIVHVRILEGFIDEIKVVGNAKKSKSIIQAYLRKITQSRPLQVKVLEHYLLLVNNVPGVKVRAVLEPSKTTLAASILNLVTETNTFTGYLSYDNYGSLYIGPNQGTVNAGVNSIFASGDATRITYITTSRPKQLQYSDLNYSIPFGGKGLRFTADVNQSNTRPGLNLRPLKIEGKSNNYMGTLNYPLILTRETNLALMCAFNYTDSGVNTFGQTLYQDHTRSLEAGANLDYSDQHQGTNNLNATLEQGLNILGASHNPASPTISRLGATGVFTKISGQGSRLQRIGNRFSFLLLARGQYSFQPLLATEQYAFGGSLLGRGYDAADIIGDLGVGGTAELRVDISPQWRLLQFLQPYVFYDGGIIWNRKKVSSLKTKQSETSTGLGIRFVFTKNIIGGLLWAQPLTKQDATEAIVGDGRRPRGYFSVTIFT
jgi:hemolysin activation/secretion protein